MENDGADGSGDQGQFGAGLPLKKRELVGRSKLKNKLLTNTRRSLVWRERVQMPAATEGTVTAAGLNNRQSPLLLKGGVVGRVFINQGDKSE
jgi:hypothetical protein